MNILHTSFLALTPSGASSFPVNEPRILGEAKTGCLWSLHLFQVAPDLNLLCSLLNLFPSLSQVTMAPRTWDLARPPPQPHQRGRGQMSDTEGQDRRVRGPGTELGWSQLPGPLYGPIKEPGARTQPGRSSRPMPGAPPSTLPSI